MKLLKQLYEIYSPSRKETKMRDFLKKYLKDYKVEEDIKGNLFVTKGKSKTYPCIVSHIDQVQNAPCKAYRIGNLFVGTSLSGDRPEGLGADDKNGIWIALKCIEKFDAIKLAFFVEEEIGCGGSSYTDNLRFFNNCRFIIQCDRKNGKDFITSISSTEICSEEFIKDCNISEWGFKKESGFLTDVYTLRKRNVKCSCVNISCGYYEPHTSREYTNVDDLNHTLEFVEHIISDCTKVYTYEYTPKSYWGCGDYDWRKYYCGNSSGNSNLFSNNNDSTKQLYTYDDMRKFLLSLDEKVSKLSNKVDTLFFNLENDEDDLPIVNNIKTK